MDSSVTDFITSGVCYSSKPASSEDALSNFIISGASSVGITLTLLLAPIIVLVPSPSPSPSLGAGLGLMRA